MKPAENVWDAIAADLAAVTAATNGPDDKSSEDLGAELQKSKNNDSSHDSVGRQVESCLTKGTQTGTVKGADKETKADSPSNAVPDSSGLPLTDESQGGVKIASGSSAEPVVPKGAEGKKDPDSAQNVVELLSDSSEEDDDDQIDDSVEGEKKDRGENILGKRNRSLAHGGCGKKLKVQLSGSDVTETSRREQRSGTTPSGDTSSKEPRHRPHWVEHLGANVYLPPGLDKFRRVFTSLNTACGFLLKQQLVPSWQNVKQAMQRLSGGDGEPISIEDVRRLAQLCPRIVMLSQFSGEGDDVTFNIELFDPADAVKVDPPGGTNGVGSDSAGNNTSDAKSAVKQVPNHEAKVIVERRQKAFEMSLAQMVHHIQAPQSSTIAGNGDEPVKHPAMLPLPGMLRLPSHEGQHTLGSSMLPLPTQPIVLPPPSLMPQQLQHGFMNMSGGYTGMPFPLPVPFSSYPKPQTNNYAGYQLVNLPPLPNLPTSLPSTSFPSVVAASSSAPHRSQSTVTPPLVVDVPEVPAAPESSPYHGMSLNKAKRRRSRNWDNWEIVLLVQAKKTEWERAESSSGKDRFETSVERWKRIEKFLKENKVVDRDAAACKNKWESVLSDYKSIKDWNRKPGNTVYALLGPTEKKTANLPAVFPSSVSELMDTFQGKSHVSMADCVARNSTGVSGGAASGGDASGAEDSGEAHPSGRGGDETHGSAGRRKKSNGGSSPLVAAFDRLSANVLNIEKGRDERSERIWALENRKYDLEKSKFELQARKVDAEREDRKGLVRVLGNLAGAFHRMADKM